MKTQKLRVLVLPQQKEVRSQHQRQMKSPQAQAQVRDPRTLRGPVTRTRLQILLLSTKAPAGMLAR